MQNPKKFGELLTKAVKFIHALEPHKNLTIIQDEIAIEVGWRGEGAIRSFRAGRIPVRWEQVGHLTRVLVERGGLDRTNCDAFLKAADYPQRSELLAELFPTFIPPKPLLEPIDCPPTPMLPAPDKLFGRQETLDALVTNLVESGSPWVMVVAGLGGIGKTAVVKSTVYEAMKGGVFCDLIWWAVDAPLLRGEQLISRLRLDSFYVHIAQQLWPDMHKEWLPAKRVEHVQRALKTRPYLIVIDNVELERDLTVLFSAIEGMIGPSKFILATRTKPALVTELDIYLKTLTELPLEDVYPFLHYYADQSELTDLAQLPKDTVHQIYQITGGLPLALRLIVGMMAVGEPLSDILADLSRQQADTAEVIYGRVYTRIWSTLKPEEKTFLQAMTLAAETGASREQMQALSGLPATQFRPLLRRLLSRCLLLTQPHSHTPHYALHRLTATFLNTLTETQSLIHAIKQNLTYWAEKQKAFAWLNVEHDNVFKAVQTGLTEPATQKETIRLLISLFRFIENQGRWGEWIPIWEQASAMCPNEPPAMSFDLLIRLGHLYRFNRQFAEAIHTYKIVGKVAGKLEAAKRPQTYYGLAVAYRLQGNLETAQQYGEKALNEFYRLEEEPKWIGATLNALGLIAAEKRDWQTAKRYTAKAVSLWQEEAQPIELARAYKSWGEALTGNQEYAEALDCLQQTQMLLQPLDNKLEEVRLNNSIGTLYFQWAKTGPPDFRRENLTKAYAAFQQANTPRLDHAQPIHERAITAHNLGKVLLGQDKLDEGNGQNMAKLQQAEALLNQSQSLRRLADDHFKLAQTLSTLGEVLARQANDEAARERYAEARKLLEGILEKYPSHVLAKLELEELTEKWSRLSEENK